MIDPAVFARVVKYSSAEAFTPPTADTPSDEGFVYHGTHHYNLADIVNDGHLDIFRPWHGTEQDTWPDGSREKRNYWSPLASGTRHFIPEGGRPVVLRTPFDAKVFKRESGTGDIYSKKRIPTHRLEVLVGGEWVPVTRFAAPENDAEQPT